LNSYDIDGVAQNDTVGVIIVRFFFLNFPENPKEVAAPNLCYFFSATRDQPK